MAFGDDRLRYAKRALDGIALGDCFGQTFFVPDEIACKRIRDREILEEPWHFTDDTVMAIGIYRILEKYGNINQDELAKVFAENYALDWHRGYGGTAHSILRNIGEGKDWRKLPLRCLTGWALWEMALQCALRPLGLILQMIWTKSYPMPGHLRKSPMGIGKGLQEQWPLPWHRPCS